MCADLSVSANNEKAAAMTAALADPRDKAAAMRHHKTFVALRGRMTTYEKQCDVILNQITLMQRSADNMVQVTLSNAVKTHLSQNKIDLLELETLMENLAEAERDVTEVATVLVGTEVDTADVEAELDASVELHQSSGVVSLLQTAPPVPLTTPRAHTKVQAQAS